MPVINEVLNLGDLLKYEAPNLYSRDQVTVAAGQNLVLGTVVGIDATTAKVKQIDPAATDGTEVAVGVLATSVDASLIDREDGILIARHAVVPQTSACQTVKPALRLLPGAVRPTQTPSFVLRRHRSRPVEHLPLLARPDFYPPRTASFGSLVEFDGFSVFYQCKCRAQFDAFLHPQAKNVLHGQHHRQALIHFTGIVN